MIINILGLLGTAAFAVSGAMMGIKKELDLFGVFVLAVLTASGGGIIRDVLIGAGLPVFFTESRYILVTILAFIVTCLFYRVIISSKVMMYVQVFDAIGLGVFSIISAYKGILFEVPFIGILFISISGGVGGGMFRDIMVLEVPTVLKSEIYAVASIVGAASFYFLFGILNIEILIYLCTALVILIRLLSYFYKVNLPTTKRLLDR